MKPVDRTPATEATDALDASRRAFLKNAGKFAVYTPPAMLALSSPSFKAIAQSSGGNDQSPPRGGGNGADDRSRRGPFADGLRDLLRRRRRR
jgi:hypothetical protein